MANWNGSKKTIFPNRDAVKFKKNNIAHKTFISACIERLKIEKDVFVLVTGDTGCQPAGDKVLMSDGTWTNIENIKVGDEVISPQKDGKNIFSKVTSITNWFCDNVFDVVQTNRSHNKLYSCSNNHIIPFYHKFYERGTDENKKRYYKSSKWDIKEYKAENINNMCKKGFSHINIGFSSYPIEKFKNRNNCKIKPYSLGVWLGDGSFSKALNITSNDEEVIERVKQEYKLMSIYDKKGTTCKSYAFSILGDFAKDLNNYGLRYKKSGDKFIPQDALYSDLNYRLKLLAGLIDSDSYYANGGYNYVSKSKKLIEDIKELIFSIGGRAYDIIKVKKKIKSYGFEGEYYSINFYLGDMKLPIVTERRMRKKKKFYLAPNRMAIYTQKSKPQKVYGFSLDSDSKWYITNNYMVTHNSGKSNLIGNFCLKDFSKIPNFITNEGMMFDRDNFIISPAEFAAKMITQKGSVLWIDEGRDAVNRQKWFSEINQTVASRKNRNRKNFNIYFLLLPYEKEVDPKLASHLTMWLWVRRGVAEVYCKTSGRKGGTGLNIQKILDREEKYLKENPRSNFVFPTVHPEYIGRIFFNKLTAGYAKEYDKLVEEKKAVGELSEEEKLAFGIVEKLTPERIINNAIDGIKDRTMTNKRELWNHLKKETELDDTKLLKSLNFYLKLEGFDSFGKLFDKSKLEQVEVDW